MPKVRAIDTERRKKWLDIFGRNTLPVISDKPTLTETINGESAIAYSLAFDQLSPAQQNRLVDYFVLQEGPTLDNLVRRLIVEMGIGLPADGLMLVQEED